MADVLEYLNTNKLHAYPFKDNCTREILYPNANRPAILSNDTFLDFQLVVSDPTILRAALKRIVRIESTELFLTFSLLSSTGSTRTCSFSTTHPTEVYQTCSSSFTPSAPDTLVCTARFVAGADLLALPVNVPYTLVVNFSTICSAELCASTIIYKVAQLNSAAFKNHPDTLIYTYTPAATDFALNEGSNVSFAQLDSSSASITVGAGLGAGLYNPCLAVEPNILYSVNTIRADNRGNLALTADSCHHITNAPTRNTVYIDFPCKDTVCDAKEVQSLAYYINRLRNGMQQLNTYINAAVQKFQVSFETYKLEQEAKAQALAPYIEADYSTFKNGAKNYFSFAVGIYDPNKSSLNLSLNAMPTAYNNGTPYVGSKIELVDRSLYPAKTQGEPDVWSGWVQLYQKALLKEKIEEYSISPTQAADPLMTGGLSYFTNRSVDCRDVVTFTSGFSLLSGTEAVPLANLNSTIEWRLKAEQETYPSTAYKYCVVLPRDIYFTVKSRRIYETLTGGHSRYHYYVTMDLFNTLMTQDRPIYEDMNTQVYIECPLPFSFVTGSARRILNGVETVITPTIPQGQNPTLHFGSLMTFPERNAVKFEIVSADAPIANIELTLLAYIRMFDGDITYRYPYLSGNASLTLD